MDRDGLSIEQLAEQAGVSVRTVRYYISQGLLPGPAARGKYASYDDDHLARLQLIRRLVDQHVPLAEQRQQLQQLSADDLRGLLQAEEQHARAMQQAPSPREYVSQLLAHARATAADSRTARAATSASLAPPAPPLPSSAPAVSAPSPSSASSAAAAPVSPTPPGPPPALAVASAGSAESASPTPPGAPPAPAAAMPPLTPGCAALGQAPQAPVAAPPAAKASLTSPADAPADVATSAPLANAPHPAPPADTSRLAPGADASSPAPLADTSGPAPRADAPGPAPPQADAASAPAAFRRRALLVEAAPTPHAASAPPLTASPPEQLQRWELAPGVELLVSAAAAERHANLIERLLQTARAFLPRRDTTP
jgi:DNA-binding transcriptional MerR regulator